MVKLARTKAELSEALAGLQGEVALVMTMGALHDGHMTIVREARKAAPNVVVSIFVNPRQFAPGEDYESYPRDLEADLALLDDEIVFAPEVEEIYPREPLVTIDPGPVATILEGASRPTHFAGVLQIVHKVFNLVRPTYAFFGQKDAQQLALVRTMVADLDMPVTIRAVPIVRDVDGLALSSRNAYLSATERIQALALSQALFLGKDAAGRGLDPLEIARRYLAEAPGVTLDYLVLVDPDTFEEIEPGQRGEGEAAAAADGVSGGSRAAGDASHPVGDASGAAARPAAANVTGDASGAAARPAAEAAPTDKAGRTALLALAARVGTTRLLDNMEIELH
ncbi:MAG: pantoate--beta-alanine ligase [Actinomycetaceae bacterium]|nr:pantoate--beta-alanine ligase [Actinomycetaceae bacterium]